MPVTPLGIVQDSKGTQHASADLITQKEESAAEEHSLEQLLRRWHRVADLPQDQAAENTVEPSVAARDHKLDSAGTL